MVLTSCYTGPQATETVIETGDGVLIVDTYTTRPRSRLSTPGRVKLPWPYPTGIALAPKGEKPAVVMAETVEVTATIRVVDPADRKLTLEFVDGSMKTVKVGRGTDLSNVAPGESLRIQLTEAVAISVSAP